MKIRTAYFEITNQCNLNCKTCYNRSGLNKIKSEITVEQLEKSIKMLINLGCKRILFGGGEPSLHSKFDEVLDFINKYPDISFGVVTNGITYNEKLLEMCQTKSNITIQVSLDGSCEETNTKTRGEGSFEKVEKFINGLSNCINKPLIKMVISQNNIDDVENFYRFAVSKNCVPEYAFVFKQGNGSKNWELMMLNAKQKLQIIKLIGNLNCELKTKAFLPICTSRCPLSHDFENLSLVVKTDGNIVPCQMLYDDYFVLGNLFDFNIDSFTSRLGEVSELVKKRENTDYGCIKCILKSHCKKGCMALAYHINGDPLAADGECEFRKLQLIGFQMQRK